MQQLQKAQLVAAIDAVTTAKGGELILAAYGSLPNKPEPRIIPLSPTLIRGYRKELCIAVNRCRGTLQMPGRVAGLVPDTADAAMALLMLATGDRQHLIERLTARGLNGLAYDPTVLTCDLPEGNNRLALGFTVSIWHRDFRQESLDDQARSESPRVCRRPST